MSARERTREPTCSLCSDRSGFACHPSHFLSFPSSAFLRLPLFSLSSSSSSFFCFFSFSVFLFVCIDFMLYLCGVFIFSSICLSTTIWSNISLRSLLMRCCGSGAPSRRVCCAEASGMIIGRVACTWLLSKVIRSLVISRGCQVLLLIEITLLLLSVLLLVWRSPANSRAFRRSAPL